MDNVNLEIAKNAASNGRLFSVGVAAVDLYAQAHLLALLALLPVGLSCLLDGALTLDHPKRPIMSAAIHTIGAAVFLASLVAVW